MKHNVNFQAAQQSKKQSRFRCQAIRRSHISKSNTTLIILFRSNQYEEFNVEMEDHIQPSDVPIDQSSQQKNSSNQPKEPP
jgi:hypothetical protein